MSIQEQFARLELQRLEQQQQLPRDGQTSNEFVNEDTLNPPESSNETDDENPPRSSIDPSTTSIILFPGQGTQFVGMG